MHIPDLYDRIVEYQRLRSLIADEAVRSLFLTGESGVGKSVLLEKSIGSLGLKDAVITFSFKTSGAVSGASLVTFLLDLYKKSRPSLLERFTYLQPKDVQLRFYFGSISSEPNQIGNARIGLAKGEVEA